MNRLIIAKTREKSNPYRSLRLPSPQPSALGLTAVVVMPTPPLLLLTVITLLIQLGGWSDQVLSHLARPFYVALVGKLGMTISPGEPEMQKGSS
jgi:hypothetical protein